jgi:hypothetical protein
MVRRDGDRPRQLDQPERGVGRERLAGVVATTRRKGRVVVEERGEDGLRDRDDGTAVAAVVRVGELLLLARSL